MLTVLRKAPHELLMIVSFSDDDFEVHENDGFSGDDDHKESFRSDGPKVDRFEFLILNLLAYDENEIYEPSDGPLYYLTSHPEFRFKEFYFDAMIKISNALLPAGKIYCFALVYRYSALQ